MKGRKQKSCRRRTHATTSGAAIPNTQPAACYDCIPDSQEDTIQSILLQAQCGGAASRRSGFSHVRVGGLGVWLDLANTEEVCQLVTAMQADGPDGEAVVQSFGESLQEHRVFVARTEEEDGSGGKVVAAAIYGPSALSRRPKQVVVSGYVYVSKDCRGQGVGRDFLHHCCVFAQKYGFQAVIAEVPSQDNVATGFLNSGGFQIFGGLPQIALSSASTTDSQENKLLVLKMLGNLSFNASLKLSRL